MRYLTVLLSVLTLLGGAFAQTGPISAGPTTIENAYPETVTFQVDLSSSAGSITTVDLYVRVRGSSSAVVLPAAFTPGPAVTARAVWETRQASIPPGAPIEYQWVVRDDAGSSFKTPAAEYVIIDSRFDWQERQNESLAVWWYRGDEAFGRYVFDMADRALQQMQEATGQTLPFRLHIVLYPDQASFASWHRYVQDWVGGQAFNGIGLTVQIIPPNSNRGWIDEVIPHEIAHLFFFQIVDNPLAPGPPNWLVEGFAQFYEYSTHAGEHRMVRQAAADGTLVPLRLATGSFSGDDDRIHLLYAESLSAVEFLHERWGDEGLADLLAAFREGLNTDEALLRVTGLDFEDFQIAWWEWLGGTPGMYPTPVVWSGNPTPAGTATPPLPEPTYVPPTTTPKPDAQGSPTLTCDLGFITLTFGLVIGLSRRRRVRRME